MPVSPELAADLAKATVELYLQAEQTMLAAVARRLERGVDQPGWAEMKLAEVQQLRREAEAVVESLTDDAPAEVDKAVRTAFNRGVATAGTDLTKAGISEALAFGRTNLAAVDALVTETVTTIRATHVRILRSTLDGYRDVIADASGQLTTGTLTRRDAAQRALDRFAMRGISGFVDRSGRSWDLASYTEMAVRTSSARAAVQGHTDRLVENGHDLVIVSDSPQECELCRPFEGKVLSVTGTTTGRASDGTPIDASLSAATSAGLFHPGCRHSTGLYVPGLTRPLRGTADPQGDADRQRLRQLERHVRAWKRREQVAITDDARRQAGSKVREWQAAIREHTASTSAKRQPARERLGAR